MSRDSGDPYPAQSPYIVSRTALRASGRVADRCVVIVAALLVLTAIGGYFYHRQQAARRSDDLRLIVTGPSTLHAGVEATYSISATTVAGKPLSAKIEAASLGLDGKRLAERNEAADARGQLRFTVPADLSLPPQLKLKVIARHGEDQATMESLVNIEPVEYVSQLALDKPLYQPGETVSYRSLTLSRFALQPAAKAQVHFELHDPKGTIVPQSSATAAAERGVAVGQFRIPAEQPSGRYTLACRTVVGSAKQELSRDFFIRRYQLPQFEKQLTFTGDSYRPGEKVAAQFSARRLDGSAAESLPIQISASVDGKIVYDDKAVTGKGGAAKIEFELPEKLERGEGQLAVTIDGKPSDSITEPVPINLGNIDVTFYPEGGELTPDLENRVYFTARDSMGRPLRLSGTIVTKEREEEESGNEIAAVETLVDGRGFFSMVPREGETYRLKVTRPAGVDSLPELPDVSPDRDVVLSVGQGVYEAGEPLAFNLRASESDRPLVVAAYCRGVEVARHQLVTRSGASVANPVSLTLPDSVAGVIELVAYDYNVHPPAPIAERMVYRRPARYLKVQMTGLEDHYKPGEQIDATLTIVNEKGEPARAAVGLTLVNEALWRMAGETPRSMPAEFAFGNELEMPESSDADILLSNRAVDGVPAAVALDLFLATQSPMHGQRQNIADAQRPPLVFDNLSEVREKHAEAAAGDIGLGTQMIDTVSVLSLLGAVGLLFLTAMLGLMRIAGGVHLWISAIAAVVCCAIVAALFVVTFHLSRAKEMPAAFASNIEPVPEAAPKSAISPQTVPAANTLTTKPRDRSEGLWQPMLIAGPDGKVPVRFKLPENAGRYRLTVDAQGDGRLGESRQTITVSNDRYSVRGSK